MASNIFHIFTPTLFIFEMAIMKMEATQAFLRGRSTLMTKYIIDSRYILLCLKKSLTTC